MATNVARVWFHRRSDENAGIQSPSRLWWREVPTRAAVVGDGAGLRLPIKRQNFVRVQDFLGLVIFSALIGNLNPAPLRPDYPREVSGDHPRPD